MGFSITEGIPVTIEYDVQYTELNIFGYFNKLYQSLMFLVSNVTTVAHFQVPVKKWLWPTL